MHRIAVSCLLVASVPALPAAAQSPIPGYVVVGDSIEFGLGDDIGADGFGYVPLVAAILASFIGPPAVHNFGEPFADTRDIWRAQVPEALAAAAGHVPVIVSWGGGGNDLAQVVQGPQAADVQALISAVWANDGVAVSEIVDSTDLVAVAPLLREVEAATRHAARLSAILGRYASDDTSAAS